MGKVTIEMSSNALGYEVAGYRISRDDDTPAEYAETVAEAALIAKRMSRIGEIVIYPAGSAFDRAFNSEGEQLKRQDAVDHPAHYGGDSVYETIKVLEAWLPAEQFIGFLRGNAIKHLSRAGKMRVGAAQTQDLQKAEFYTRYEAQFLRRLAHGNVGEKRWEQPVKPALGPRFDL